MILVLDIGNSRIKCGLFDNEKLTLQKSFTDSESFKLFFSQNKIDDACICSVSPKTTEIINEIIKNNSKLSPFIISHNSSTNIKIDYETPQTLGIDRICSIEGALSLTDKNFSFKKNSFIISMDCGTATTINILQSPDIFLGGTISPGINLMFHSLKTNTAQLPEVDASYLKDLIGKSTTSSIASGVINSSVGLLEKTIRHVEKTYSAKNIYLYLTGGSSENLLSYINYPFIYEKSLVLYGVFSLYKLNRK